MRNLEYKIQELRSGRIVAISPYNSEFIKLAKRMGGKFMRIGDSDGTGWVADAGWVFEAAQREDVRRAMLQAYGRDDREPVHIVDLEIQYASGMNEGDDRTLVVAGRQIAYAAGRDGPVWIGPGVTLLSGDFAGGGSRKYPALRYLNNPRFRLYGVPVGKALELVSKFPAEAKVLEVKDEHKRFFVGFENDTTKQFAVLRAGSGDKAKLLVAHNYEVPPMTREECEALANEYNSAGLSKAKAIVCLILE